MKLFFAFPGVLFVSPTTAGKTRDDCLFAKNLPEGTGGRSEQNGARSETFVGDRFTTKDSGLTAQNYAGTYMHMLADADLAGDDRAIADGTGAGDAGEGDENDVFSDVAVVADMNEVVDFCAAADACFGEGSTVNGGIGANLNVVFNDKGSLLRELRVRAGGGIADVTKTICSEHCASVDDDTIAERWCRGTEQLGDERGSVPR